jgi:glycosyltransferase involved in cell wall biosynthesis
MEDSPPTFSIIVPTYERPAQLAMCLSALARLDYPRECFEVIVVDDGSAKSPDDVVKEFRELMDVRLFSQRNAGPAAARNFGATHARGDFLAFTDDDCAPDSQWLRAFAAHFIKTPDRIIGGRTFNALPQNLCSETSQLIIEVVYSHFNANADDARFFASNNLALPLRRFREMGGFNAAFITSEDRELCDRWLALGLRMTYAPDAVIRHAHTLTLRSLWHQHFAYGQGAQRFHQARTLRGHAPFKPDRVFYLKLFRAAASQTNKTRAMQLTALLLWSQIANAAGFLTARRKAKSEGRK